MSPDPKKKILLIDDDALVAKTVARLLELNGYEVKTANNAVDALALAAITAFDLVMSDIRMPGENGIIAIRKIKEVYAEKNIHAAYIFITGYAEEDTPEHAIRLGVNKFIFKPFDNEELLNAVKEELDLLSKDETLRRAPTQTPEIIITKQKDRFSIKRVVITGIGVVAPSGLGKDAFWTGLREGKNYVDKITFFDASAYPSKMAAEIRNFNPSDFISEYTEIKRMSRSSHVAVASAKLALEDANLKSTTSLDLEVILGSATTGVEYIEPEMRALERGGPKKVRPFAGIAGFGGSISSEVSRAVSAHGLSLTVSTGCTSATDAMGYAFKKIRYAEAKTIVTGGVDACITPGILAAFCQMGAVSTRNDVKASRPFNKDRDGFVISEGGWIFIFEELEHARKRKATIYGEVLGYGATCDAWHMAKPYPSGEFSALAVQMGLQDAGIQPEEVDIFEAYGNATPINDSYETGVVKKVFGKHAFDLVMPSVKSLMGHPIGASGGQQLAAVLLALNQRYIHPTINYELPDPECDLDYVPNKGREGKFDIAVCNSIAFGAKNSCLIIRSFQK